MPFFNYTYTLPTLSPYPYAADLVVSIVTPIQFTAVSTMTGQVYLHWVYPGLSESAITLSNTYSELYRSTDFENWTLLNSTAFTATTGTDNSISYYDFTGLVGASYYYQVRFVQEVSGVITNVSEYAHMQAAKPVTLLGFEPQNQYSNMFFQYLISDLIGTKIYDQTPASTFSVGGMVNGQPNTYQWQTNCQITDSFRLSVDGSVQDTEPQNLSATYSKRPVTFKVDKKQVKIQGFDTITGQTGEMQEMHNYLIHTFLMGYAYEFLKLYQKYLTIIANKYVNYSQNYALGFKPIVSDRIDPTLAELYFTIGQKINIQPITTNTVDQGLIQYRNALTSSITNQNNTGMRVGVMNAPTNILGITTHTLFEYYKQHWMKTDRECKLYVSPIIDSSSQYTPALVNQGTTYTPIFNGYSIVLQIIYIPTTPPYGHSNNAVVLYGSNGLISVVVTVYLGALSSDIVYLISNSSIGSTSLTYILSASGGSTPITASMPPTLIRIHSLYVGWENTRLNMYYRKMYLNDVCSANDSGTDVANGSVMISAIDPTLGLQSVASVSPTGIYEESSDLHKLITDYNYSLIVERDDNSTGVSFTDAIPTTIKLAGSKNVLFTINMTTDNMTWLNSAYLNLYVHLSTQNGNLSLYRIRKQYNASDVSWNYRKKATSASGSYVWNGSNYTVSGSSTPYTIADWNIPGALSENDAQYLMDFPVVKSTTATMVSINITDILKHIYKYETSHLGYGNDPENVLNCGFMITAENMPDKSVVVVAGNNNPTYAPSITWNKCHQGFYTCSPSATSYFYVDGTERYGRLQVMQSASEPISAVVTVNERIKNADLLMTDPLQLKLNTIPATFVIGTWIRNMPSSGYSIGQITAIDSANKIVTVYQEKQSLRNFASSDNLCIVGTSTSLASVTSVVSPSTYTGNYFLRLARNPIIGSNITVMQGVTATTTSTVYPASYPSYSAWTEGGSGIYPWFTSTVSGTLNPAAAQDQYLPNKIYLNTFNQGSDALGTIKDVIVTYQYQYDFVSFGRALTDTDSVYEIDGCNRIGAGAYSMSESDSKYKSELMLPHLTNTNYSTTVEYSDHNISNVVSAIKNVRRLDGSVDVFKYGPTGYPYRIGHNYHTFFDKA